jgi:hypothetical protein
MAYTTWVPETQLGDVMATPILFLASLASLMLTTAPILFLIWLVQPSTRANPGLSAYDPPPGTRVEPIAHRVESNDPPREFSFATNFAREYVRPELAEDAQPHEAEVSKRHEARLANHNQSRVGYRRKHEQSAHAYAQEWDNHWQSRYR